MVCSHSLAGVAPGEAAQSRGDGVGSGSSRRRPSRQRLKPGWSQPVAEEGLPGRQVLLVKLPSGGFGLSNAKIAGLPGARNRFNPQWLSTAADWGDRRSPASKCSCLRHCDLCGRVCAPPAPEQPRARRTRRCSSTAVGSEHADPRLTATPRALFALRLSRGTFYFGSIRNFSLGRDTQLQYPTSVALHTPTSGAASPTCVQHPGNLFRSIVPQMG